MAQTGVYNLEGQTPECQHLPGGSRSPMPVPQKCRCEAAQHSCLMNLVAVSEKQVSQESNVPSAWLVVASTALHSRYSSCFSGYSYLCGSCPWGLCIWAAQDVEDWTSESCGLNERCVSPNFRATCLVWETKTQGRVGPSHRSLPSGNDTDSSSGLPPSQTLPRWVLCTVVSGNTLGLKKNLSYY